MGQLAVYRPCLAHITAIRSTVPSLSTHPAKNYSFIGGGGVQFLVNWTRLEDDSGKILSKKQANMAIQAITNRMTVFKDLTKKKKDKYENLIWDTPQLSNTNPKMERMRILLKQCKTTN